MVVVFHSEPEPPKPSVAVAEDRFDISPRFVVTAESLGHSPYIDVHEPVLMKSLLAQVGFQQYDLNGAGWADYYWENAEGRVRHVERKTWGELSDLDAVEEQLHRHLTKNPEASLTWLLEGVATPSDHGFTTYKEAHSRGNALFVANSSQHRPLKLIFSWLYGIGKFVEVVQTSSLLATATFLTAMYQSDQKAASEHTTLQRYYKQVTWHPNPQVSKLMSVGDGIGSVRAEALIRKFGTLWGVLEADPVEIARVPGIGLATAKKLLQRVGRGDV